ncbi:MAG: putative metal-dependent hydrolase [Acidobacteriales bacterium]|nr:putative metal-dependent hydrolase [Terriglobales bacterium]
MSDLSYPIGRFEYKPGYSAEQREQLLQQIEAAPAQMRAAVRGLSDAQLDTPYRPGGWTVRQLVHHVPESHAHSFIRFKWTLTEDTPKIKAYEESDWARTPEVAGMPIDPSLDLLEALHKRWMYLLRSLKPEDWKKKLIHPSNGEMSLERMLGLYAWHGRHHVAHITGLRERMGWK